MARLIENILHVVIVLTALMHGKHLSAEGGPTGQYFLESPLNHTIVNSGEHTRLRCVVGNMMGSCQWTRDGFGLGLDRQLPNFPRYLMPEESGRDGVCDLAIDPVLPLDEGIYQCQVSAGPGSPAISSQQVKLSVNSPPGLPHIIQAREVDQLEVEKGELVELQCESQGARPSAELNWINGDGERIVSHVTQHVTKLEDTKMFKTVSVLKFYLQRPERISCTAHSDAFPLPRTSRSLEVNFGKKPVEEVKQAVEGESFVLECKNGINAMNLKYKWFMDGEELPNESEQTLEIQEFSKIFDNSVLKCIAENKSGKSKIIKIITLKHRVAVDNPLALPLTSKKNNPGKKKKIPGEKSKKTTFTCVVEDDNSPSEPEYVWIKGKLQKVVEQDTVEATDGTNNKIICKVIPNGYKKIKQMASKMKGISKSIKRFSKTLGRISKSIDVT